MDFRKAFDTVCHQHLWERLDAYGITSHHEGAVPAQTPCRAGELLSTLCSADSARGPDTSCASGTVHCCTHRASKILSGSKLIGYPAELMIKSSTPVPVPVPAQPADFTPCSGAAPPAQALDHLAHQHRCCHCSWRQIASLFSERCERQSGVSAGGASPTQSSRVHSCTGCCSGPS
jgi:hypothetical protein